MLYESAAVVSCDGTELLLRTGRHATCSGCSLKPGCGQYLLARDRDLLAVTACHADGLTLPQDLREGEQVRITLVEGQLLRLTALFHGLPLAGLLLATLAGTALGLPEGSTILMAGAGLAGGVAVSRLLMRIGRLRRRLSPQILRMAPADSTPVQFDGSP